jgi:hypothetical protein
MNGSNRPNRFAEVALFRVPRSLLDRLTTLKLATA